MSPAVTGARRWAGWLAELHRVAVGSGWVPTFGYAMARLLERISLGRARLIAYRFVAQPVPARDGAPDGSPTSDEFRWIEGGDAVLAQLPRPPTVIERRLQSGARCLAAVRRGQLVGCLWYKAGEYMEDEVRCRFRFDPQLAVWDFDVWIHPDYRLGRLFVRLWDQAHREMSRHGWRWSLSRINSFNFASLAAHHRLGARRIGGALFFVAGRLQLTLASLAPYVHISLRADRYPTLVLRID